MPDFVNIHPTHPQERLCQQAATRIMQGELAAVPSDSSYCLVCRLDDANAVARLRRLRGLSDKHHLTLLCNNLSRLGQLARVENNQYRVLKHVLPGPYTFILEATREVPKRVSHPSKKTIGLRVPAHTVLQAILAHTDGVLIASTAQCPSATEPCRSGWEVLDTLGHGIDLIVDDGEYCGSEPTTVIDWTQAEPQLMRQGAGPLTGVLQPVIKPQSNWDGEALSLAVSELKQFF